MSNRAPQSIIERFVLGPFETNCYIVRSDDAPEAWIIDASFEPEPLIARARKLELEVSRILLTHAHVDHIAGLEQVRTAFPGASVAIHPLESSWLVRPELNLSLAMGEPVVCTDADDALQEGERLELGEQLWRVLETPGHSPGGVTLWNERDNVALVGDTLFAGSIGRFDFPTSDGEALFASIREKLYTLPEETRVLPGHGPETTIGQEKRSNPFVTAS